MSEYAQEDPVHATKPVTGKAVVVARVFMYDTQLVFLDSIQFSRSISGRKPNFEFGGSLEHGEARFEVPAPGYFKARLWQKSLSVRTGEHHWIEPAGGRWGNIPLNPGREYHIDFTVGGNYTLTEASIAVVKNTAMADATASNPTAVVGATHVKVMSVVVAVDKNNGYYFSNLLVVSDLPAGVLGRVFRNLKVMFGNTQVGITWGTLNDSPFTFQFGHSAVMPAESRMVVDLYADVSSSASAEDLAAINNHQGGILRILPIEAVNMVSGQTVRSWGEVSGQRVYLVEHGSMVITRSPRSPVQQSTRRGEEVVADVYKVNVGLAEDVQPYDWKVSVIVKDKTGRTIDPNTVLVGQVRLYKDTFASDNFLALAEVDNWGIFPLTNMRGWNNTLFEIKKGESRNVVLTYRVPTGATPGTRLQFALYSLTGGRPSVTAFGTTSGTLIASAIPKSILSDEITIVE